MDKELVQLYQQKWDTNVPLALSEAKGGKLKHYCDVATGTGMEKYTFYRDRDYSTDDNAPEMFSKTEEEYEGTSGDQSSYTAEPRFIYAHERIKVQKMQKTMLDPKANFLKGFANALDLRVDIEIMKAIEAKDKDLIKNGDVSLPITDDANILAFKQNCFLALSNVDSANVVEGVNTVAIIMDNRDYASLMPKGGTEGNMISSADFKTYQNAKGILTTSLFGCDIVTYKKFNKPAKWAGRAGVQIKGTIHWLPTHTVGLVEWESGNFNFAKYNPDNGDRWHFMCRKSVGAVAIEPESIIKMSVKP